MSIVDDMAKLVLNNPNISARQIAQTLGYAEPKSVYYWLKKSGFNGMKHFRQEVLKKNIYLQKEQSGPQTAREQPIRTSMPTDLVRYLEDHLQQGSLAFVITKDSGNTARQGDMAIVDPEGPLGQGDLVLTKAEGANVVLRNYISLGSKLFVNPENPGKPLSPDFVMGKILLIIRKPF